MFSQDVHIEDELKTKAEQWLQQAYTVIWFPDIANTLAAIAIAIAGKIKPSSPNAVKQLQSLGIDIYIK
ncbi:MAG: copper-translocating P-type ATPase [Segetibacter sp.]|nr:copper-translocating P-type ATPase [Segetibacter sp.]